MSRSCLTAFDSREADDPSSMAPGFYAFPFEDYDRAPVGPFPTYVEAVTAARALERTTIRVTRALTVLDTDKRPSAVDLSGAMSFAIRGEHRDATPIPALCIWALELTAVAGIMWC